jgi:hypothetical protein
MTRNLPIRNLLIKVITITLFANVSPFSISMYQLQRFQSISQLLDAKAEIRTDQKQQLQELASYLFNIRNPVYVWETEDSGSIVGDLLSIDIADGRKYEFKFESSGDLSQSVADKKRSNKRQSISNTKKLAEHYAASLILAYLESQPNYQYLLSGWRRNRDNKNNIPRVITRNNLLRAAAGKSVVVMVDAENIPDYRRNFYVDSQGDVRFLSPVIPRIVSAPRFDNTESESESEVELDAGSVQLESDRYSEMPSNSQSQQSRVNRQLSGSESADTLTVLTRSSSQAGPNPNNIASSLKSRLQSYPTGTVLTSTATTGSVMTSTTAQSRQRGSQIKATDEMRQYGDEDILVLTYAHIGSGQSPWANRLTASTQKDAADGTQRKLCDDMMLVPDCITHWELVG